MTHLCTIVLVLAQLFPFGFGLRPKVATPVLSPATSHASHTTVAITCATVGATIYWNNTGTYSVYSGPVDSGAGDKTVSAYATKPGYSNSSVVIGTYGPGF